MNFIANPLLISLIIFVPSLICLFDVCWEKNKTNRYINCNRKLVTVFGTWMLVILAMPLGLAIIIALG
jgi:hypothetical protein